MENIQSIVMEIGNFTYQYVEKYQGVAVLNYVGNGEEVIRVPDQISYKGVCYPVVQLCPLCFWSAANAKTIYLPSTIVSFAKDSFDGCNELNDVYYSGKLKLSGAWGRLHRKVTVKSSEEGILVETYVEPNEPTQKVSYYTSYDKGDKSWFKNILKRMFAAVGCPLGCVFWLLYPAFLALPSSALLTWIISKFSDKGYGESFEWLVDGMIAIFWFCLKAVGVLLLLFILALFIHTVFIGIKEKIKQELEEED